jgi:hypothetical protein
MQKMLLLAHQKPNMTQDREEKLRSEDQNRLATLNHYKFNLLDAAQTFVRHREEDKNAEPKLLAAATDWVESVGTTRGWFMGRAIVPAPAGPTRGADLLCVENWNTPGEFCFFESSSIRVGHPIQSPVMGLEPHRDSRGVWCWRLQKQPIKAKSIE